MINDERMTLNRSKTYIFPLLSEIYAFPSNIVHSLRNTYLFDKDNLHSECIYLLFNYDISNPHFTKFEHEFSKIPEFEKYYDLKNNMILFVVKFPEVFLNDYYHFIRGEYSKFSKEAKTLIINYLTSRKVSGLIVNNIKMIFRKDPELRESIETRLRVNLEPNCELGELINEEKETIDITSNIIDYNEQ